jgi:hypothetical protein
MGSALLSSYFDGKIIDFVKIKFHLNNKYWMTIAQNLKFELNSNALNWEKKKKEKNWRIFFENLLWLWCCKKNLWKDTNVTKDLFIPLYLEIS